jgi:hypothetical protein
MRLSDAQVLIENVVRAQAAEIADCWYWGSAGRSGAESADGRTLYAYWQTDVATHENLAPKMLRLRDRIKSLDAVDAIRIRDFTPDTGYDGPPVVGEQWEIHLAVDVARPERVTTH